MNLWIDIARDELLEIIRSVDCLILNDEELRQLTGKPNLDLRRPRDPRPRTPRWWSPSRASTARP